MRHARTRLASVHRELPAVLEGNAPATPTTSDLATDVVSTAIYRQHTSDTILFLLLIACSNCLPFYLFLACIDFFFSDARVVLLIHLEEVTVNGCKICIDYSTTNELLQKSRF